MFDKRDVHKKVALLWILFLVVILAVHHYTIQPYKNNTLNEISLLENNIAQKNWEEAKQNQLTIEQSWKTHKLWIQLNNLSPAVSRFEQKLKAG